MVPGRLAVLAAAVVASDACLLVHDTAFADQSLKIEAHGDNAIRVRAVPLGGSFRDDLVSALVASSGAGSRDSEDCAEVWMSSSSSASSSAAASSSSARAGDSPANFTSGNLNVVADPATGKLSFTRVSDGKTLLREQSVRKLANTTTTPSLPGFLNLDLAFEAVDGERIYGLGQHKTGKLDNKGVKGLGLAPHNTEMLIPVVHSSEEFVFLFNLPSFGTVEYNDTGSYWHADTVVQCDFWVATTSTSPPHPTSPWAQLQHAYANATGHAPVLPSWVSGFWQSKNRYHNRSQLVGIANGYIDRGHPLSLIIIDYFSWSPGPLGNEVFPESCWPDPASMITELQAQGVEVMVSPYFHSLTDQAKPFAAAKAQDLLVLGKDGQPTNVGYANAYLYDLFQPQAREFAWQQAKQGYIDQYNLRHFWLDCDEPCGGDVSDLIYNNGTWPASFVGAAYPHMLNQMVYEGSKGNPLGQSVMLARSAWAGSQRFGAAVWSGDTSSTFNDLNQQFRAGLNVAMSGLPYWTTDIGGYGGGNIDDPTFQELIVRWFQWGAFCSLFRLHGHRSGGPSQEGGLKECGNTNSANEVWMFGEKAEAAIGPIMALREQLRPYIDSLYREASATGAPVIRPLFYDFWDQTGAQLVDDQMMFGPDYLVAPQLNKGGTTRSVFLPQLPPSHVWKNVFTQVRTNTSTGAKNITESTPLSGPGFGTLPLYFREPYAPAPGPPAPLAPCDKSCTITPNLDAGHYTSHVDTINPSASDAECCEQCIKNVECDAFVRGPDPGTTNNTCYLLAGVDSYKTSSDRNFGCVRS